MLAFVSAVWTENITQHLQAKRQTLKLIFAFDHIDHGRDPEVLKRDSTLCRPPWLADEKISGVRWSKRAKIALETTSFWQNISISIFKFSPFLYTMKACQWNLINFSKFANALIRKEKKHLCSSQWEKKNLEKLDFVL